MGVGDDRKQVPLAVIGMACRVPGADGLDAFWQMLIEGRSGTGPLPPDRFDRELYYDPEIGARNKSYTDLGGIVPHRPEDDDSSPLPADLARTADVSHRILCEVAGNAFRHAGLDPYNLRRRNCGVYVGHTIGSEAPGDALNAKGVEESADCLRRLDAWKDLAELSPAKKDAVLVELIERVRSENPRNRNANAFRSHQAAALISKTFGLSGPFVAVNAACASSLQALVLAARALERGEIEMAVVGGASVCGRDWLVLFSHARSLSPGGSRPFDQSADGLIVAEAYVALVVKTLEQAIADGDPIQGVIRGLGVSSDGKGRSLWAPRSEGQVAAIERAYGPGVEIGDVQYIEAHATATQLGDATEIASLRQAFAGALPSGKKIPIASVKANIGHALEAAGLVGVVKALLCMQKGMIPRAIHVETLNPKVDWDAAPVFVPLQTIAWPEPSAGKPRRAGVNAFGIGGLNVHVVLDATPDVSRSRAARNGALGPRGVSKRLRSRSHDSQADAVAIIGLGCVFPGAPDVAAFRNLLLENGSAVGAVDGFRYDWRRHRIPPREIELADPLQFMLLEAADQAFADAGYDRRSFDRGRTGVVVGAEFTGAFHLRLQHALRLPHTQRVLVNLLQASGVSDAVAARIARAFGVSWHFTWPVLEDGTGSFSASSLAVRIAKTWDLMGCSFAVDSGATSGMSALQAAIHLLLAGDCDLMICGAAQRHDPSSAPSPQYNHARRSGNAAEPTLPTRTGAPFDREGGGSVAGDGAAAFLLKRLRDAQNDGDVIHAVVHGLAAVCAVPTFCLKQALGDALHRSNQNAADLALVMTDACGLPPEDEEIVRAVMATLAGSGRRQPLPIASVVGHVGHTGCASSAASMLAAILSLSEGFVPGIPCFRAPLATLSRNRDHLRCAAEPAQLSAPTPDARPESTLRGGSVAVLAHGDGLACCAIVEREAPVQSAGLAESGRTVVGHGESD